MARHPPKDGTPSNVCVEEALQAYTTGPAYAAGMEDRLGKLAPGHLADLILLETDPFECTPEKLAHLKPVGTMVGGTWVWQS